MMTFFKLAENTYPFVLTHIREFSKHSQRSINFENHYIALSPRLV